jgi:hypothetical protein
MPAPQAYELEKKFMVSAEKIVDAVTRLVK